MVEIAGRPIVDYCILCGEGFSEPHDCPRVPPGMTREMIEAGGQAWRPGRSGPENVIAAYLAMNDTKPVEGDAVPWDYSALGRILLDLRQTIHPLTQQGEDRIWRAAEKACALIDRAETERAKELALASPQPGKQENIWVGNDVCPKCFASHPPTMDCSLRFVPLSPQPGNDEVNEREAAERVLAWVKRRMPPYKGIPFRDIEAVALLTLAKPAHQADGERVSAVLLEALEPFRQFASGMDKLPDHVPITNGSSMARSQLMAHHFKALYAALNPVPSSGEGQ